MKKIDLIKICVIIIAVLILLNVIVTFYYDLKYVIRNHDERKSICDNMGLVYLKTIQSSNEIVRCCEINQKKIVGCSDFLK